ncbi:MAG: C40 family peptidase [Paludibacteraceae bacterium]|nr:C40 family peptidase [Paludibacteraceae bacterium]
MLKAISLHSIIPVRTEPREGSEQSTQILFGETCDILEQVPRWNRIRLHSDGQEGWVDAKMISPIGGKDYTAYRKALKSATAMVAMPMAYAVSENNGQTIPLTAGTRLTNYQTLKPQNPQTAPVGRFEVLGVGFRIDPGMVIAQPLALNEQNLMQAVRFFLNVPYLWGGKNAMGMDCSGFTQTILSLFGKRLLRNASQQATQGSPVSLLKHAHAGDLVFFDHNDGRISHVGIILSPPFREGAGVGSCTLVHCSGRVKVEKIDETGIFSVEQADKDHPDGRYTHHLAAIRRV